MLRGILKILLIMGLVIGATYLIPKDTRQKTLSQLGSLISAVTPKSVKQKMEPVLFTPAERRKKLLNQLNENIESIKKNLTASSATTSKTSEDATSSQSASPRVLLPEEVVKKLDETKEIIEQIEKINNEGGVVNKVTTKVYKTVTKGNTEATSSETCACEK